MDENMDMDSYTRIKALLWIDKQIGDNEMNRLDKVNMKSVDRKIHENTTFELYVPFTDNDTLAGFPHLAYKRGQYRGKRYVSEIVVDKEGLHWIMPTQTYHEGILITELIMPFHGRPFERIWVAGEVM
jgi:hypothetical protein